jgi:hypothetical protein
MSKQVSSNYSHLQYTSNEAAGRTIKKRNNSSLVTPIDSIKKPNKGRPSDSKSYIDLTEDALSVFVIRNQHTLFFSYDPTGSNDHNKVGIAMCDMCDCPQIYCSNIVFGDLAATRAMSLMKDNDIHSYDGDDEVGKVFENEYKKLVISNMIWNNIRCKDIDNMEQSIHLPMCIIQGSLTRLCRDVCSVRNDGKVGDTSCTSVDLSRKVDYCVHKDPKVSPVFPTILTIDSDDSQDKHTASLKVIKESLVKSPLWSSDARLFTRLSTIP